MQRPRWPSDGGFADPRLVNPVRGLTRVTLKIKLDTHLSLSPILEYNKHHHLVTYVKIFSCLLPGLPPGAKERITDKKTPCSSQLCSSSCYDQTHSLFSPSLVSPFLSHSNRDFERLFVSLALGGLAAASLLLLLVVVEEEEAFF